MDWDHKTYDTENLADVKTEKYDSMELGNSSVIREKKEMLDENEMDHFDPDIDELNEDEMLPLPPLIASYLFHLISEDNPEIFAWLFPTENEITSSLLWNMSCEQECFSA
ncbi:hypothetical protein TNCV_4126431 [Trichonephila clavipes]|nr:hypothetical protein TNCV_4126431 [Trichonephila clavipes]